MLPILHQSYWRDEAFSVLLSLKSIKDIFFLTAKDVHPPLYYFFLHYWMKIFGDAEYVTRTFSFLTHLLIVLTCFFLIKHFIKNWKISLLGAFAVFLNPFLLEYAFDTTSYMFFALTVIMATLFYLKKNYVISALFLGLMVFSHNFGIFFFIPFLVYWFYENRENWTKQLKGFFQLFGFSILVFLGWSVFLYKQWVKVASGYWIGPKTSSIFVDSFRVFFQGNPDYPSRAMLYNLTLILVFLAFSYWVIRATKKKEKNNIKKESLLLIFLFSIPFLIVYIISAYWVPIYHERYLIPALPIFIVWVVISLFKLSKRSDSLSCYIFAFVVAYLLFSVQSSEELLRKTTKPPINWGVKEVLSKVQSGDVIIPENNMNFLETKYYVQKSGENIPVYAYSEKGFEEIPFYLGRVLFEKKEIIEKYPVSRGVWFIKSDGGYYQE